VLEAEQMAERLLDGMEKDPSMPTHVQALRHKSATRE
jgi:hypothetical protein